VSRNDVLMYSTLFIADLFMGVVENFLTIFLQTISPCASLGISEHHPFGSHVSLTDPTSEKYRKRYGILVFILKRDIRKTVGSTDGGLNRAFTRCSSINVSMGRWSL